MNNKIIFFLILVLGMSNCSRNISYNKKKLKGIEEINLLGIIQNENKKQYNPDHLVQYPSLIKSEKVFLENLLDTFNTNQWEVKITFFTLEEQKKIFTLNNHPPAATKIKENLIITIANNPNTRKVNEKDFFQYMDLFKKKYYLIISFTHDPWLQKISGYFKVFNQNKKVVWSEEIKHRSYYIIYDSDSPYLIKNRSIAIPAKKKTHYEEINLVYEKLGGLVGLSLQQTLDKINQ